MLCRFFCVLLQTHLLIIAAEIQLLEDEFQTVNG